MKNAKDSSFFFPFSLPFHFILTLYSVTSENNRRLSELPGPMYVAAFLYFTFSSPFFLIPRKIEEVGFEGGRRGGEREI
jgi:hypothetical protein